MERTSFLIMVVVAAVFLGGLGCSTVQSSHRQDIGTPRYPSSNPVDVEVIRFIPGRPHVHLGKVQVKLPNPNVDPDIITAALQKESATLGADAIVIVLDRTGATGTVMESPTWAHSLEAIKGCVVVGIAIKYP